MKVKCPMCAASCDWEGNPWRPFCSERCRMIDLGAWIDEDYKVGHEPTNNDTEYESETY
ncbi:MAG: DNA gyrase inhibitor YacG [Desulfobacteraceae bacterium 4572_35.1]|nr:MAG: DNA gyrase inhibitor YacG [Desulfobacteraceae bacterium 4572_35.1]